MTKEDQTHVSSHRPRRLLVLAAVLALSSAVAMWVDLPLARWIGTGGFPGDLAKVVQLSEAFAHGSGVALVLLAALAIDPRHYRVLPRLLIASFGSGLLADVAKLIMGRTRPKAFDLTLPVHESFLGWFTWRHADTWAEALAHHTLSFPSGHSATATGLACGLSRLYPQATWCFTLLAMLACFQRIESSAHYLSDVFAGAAVGVIVNAVLELPRYRQWLARCEDNHH